MIDFDVLKQELFQEITDKKYKGELLVNVFLKDSAYVKQMVKEGKCSQDALVFLESNIQRLADIYNQVSIPYFRTAQYEELLRIYCDKNASQFIKIEISNELPNKEITSAKLSVDTKNWLISNWNMEIEPYFNYIVKETMAARIVWRASMSGKSFKAELEDARSLKLRRSIHKDKTTYCLVRQYKKKKRKDGISKSDFDKLYSLVQRSIDGTLPKLDVQNEVLSNKTAEVSESVASIVKKDVAKKKNASTSIVIVEEKNMSFDNLIRYVANDTLDRKVKWKAFIDGKTFTTKLSSGKVVTL